MLKISVVIPCFNSGKFLAATLNSIRWQDYSRVEVIIVDGGSTDETAAVVAQNADLISRFVSEKDRGQLDAVQKGVRLATGDVVMWLNADDIVMPGAFAYVVKRFADDPTVDIVYSDNFAFEESSKKLFVGPTIRNLLFPDHALFYRQMYSECVYWRSSVTKFVDERFVGLRVYTDYAFLVNLRRGCRVAWVPKRLGAFRIVENQASARNHQLKRGEYRFIRDALYRELGWGEARRFIYRCLWGPCFFMRHFVYPKAQSALRRLWRVMTSDMARKKQAQCFFNSWLSTGTRATSSGIESELFR